MRSAGNIPYHISVEYTIYCAYCLRQQTASSDLSLLGAKDQFARDGWEVVKGRTLCLDCRNDYGYDEVDT